LGLNITPITYLPLHNSIGLSIAGGGSSILSLQSLKYPHIYITYDLFKNLSFWVSKKLAVKKSYVAAIKGAPSFGTQIFLFTLIKILASALASSV
jgi:hypothetical protein